MNKKKKTRFLMKSDLRVEESVSSIPCDLFLVIGANGTSMDQLSCPLVRLKVRMLPENHGIPKLVVWRSQNPAKNSFKPLCFGGSSDS